MAKVTVHEPEPVKMPPPTYDIIGLTENEMRLIVTLVGMTTIDVSLDITGSDVCAYGLYDILPPLYVGTNFRLSPID